MNKKEQRVRDICAKLYSVVKKRLFCLIDIYASVPDVCPGNYAGDWRNV